MKPAPFDYHAPTSVDEATELLAKLADDAKVIAGGQSLVPLLSLRLVRVDHLIDLNRIEALAGITEGEQVEIGACSRHGVVESSPFVRSQIPLVSDALSFVGHRAIRNRGTIGGSIAHADPAAELPAALLALDGSVMVRNTAGEREIQASDLFTGFLSTSLEPDEILTHVRFPRWDEGTGWSVQEFARRSGDFALAGVMTVLGLGADGKIAKARVALFGVASAAVRAEAAEELLVGELPSAELWSEAAERVAAGIDPPSDLHGSSAYRRQLAKALVRRSLQESATRLGAA